MSGNLSELEAALYRQLACVEYASAEDLETEGKRSESLVKISDQILRSADLRIKAAKLYKEHGDQVLPMLPQIGGKKP